MTVAARRARTARSWWSRAAWFAMMAGSNLATPLYAIYEREFGFSKAVLTLVFATYALVLAPSLLVFGQLSDRLGRRRVMAAGFATATVGLVLFALASGLPWLFAARAVQGLAVGMISGAAAAALVELDPAPQEDRAALFAALAQAGGSASGPLVAGVLAEWAPERLVLPFAIFIVLGVVRDGRRAGDPRARPGRPRPRCTIVRPSVPPEIRVLFARVSLTGAAVWAVAALFLSVVPSYAAELLDTSNLALLGAISALMLAASCAAQIAARRVRAHARMQAAGLRPARRGPARARRWPSRPARCRPARRRPAHRRRPRARLPRRPGPAQPRRPARPPRRGQRGLLHADLPRRRDRGHLDRPPHAPRRALHRGDRVRRTSSRHGRRHDRLLSARRRRGTYRGLSPLGWAGRSSRSPWAAAMTVRATPSHE